ncbi:MAG: hypothetical protein GX683_03690 [Ruminococcaceae bacterium]|nr:hypothetical protein [Oscillospiraceae bacterium]
MKVSCLKKLYVPFDAREFISAAKGCPDDPERVAELWRLFEPLVFWRESGIKSNENGVIETADGFRIESGYVAKGLKGCSRLAVLAVTAGKRLSLAPRELMEAGKLCDGAVADMLGSYAAEAAADSFCDYLAARGSSKKLFLSLRFSPGYGDWSISEQGRVMDYLEGCAGEIELSAGNMLLPEKTITAAVGFSGAPIKKIYPVGDKSKGFCAGDKKCSECRTWECRR